MKLDTKKFLRDLESAKLKWLEHKTGRKDIVDMSIDGWTTDKGVLLTEDDGLPPPYDSDQYLFNGFNAVKDAINETE